MGSNTVDRRQHSQMRTYDRISSVVFFKTKETFGGLSNMAGGYPLRVNGIRILTSEALYQACRFPHLADVQRLIIGQKSPMTAKMKSKLYRHRSRPDWNRVRVSTMRWCLRVKLAQNWDSFSKLLLQTDDRPIVEQSRRDDFWGALPVGERTLVGMNVLGRLLMELRESLQAELQGSLLRVEPLSIHNFLLGGRPIETVIARELDRPGAITKPFVRSGQPQTAKTSNKQLPLPTTLKADAPPRHEDALTYVPVARDTRLTAYPAYKDSGALWLGKVPAHWQVAMVKQNYTIQLGKMLQPRPNTPQDVEIPYLKARHVQWFHVRTTDVPKMWAGQKDIAQFGVAPDDLLVCEGGEGGRCGILRQDVEGYIIQNALHRVRSREQSRNDYLQYVMNSVAAAGWFDALNNKATIAHFTREKFGALRVPVPPPPEQTTIVRFLDHADRRIRRYIRAKQKLIALLEEQKQAIIHQAVTGQVDVRTGQPYPAYKPSGVEWLGDVPAHWDLRRTKALFRLRTEKSGVAHGQELLSIYTHIGVRPRKDLEEKGNKASTTDDYWIVKPGDLIANKLLAWMGAIGVSHYDGVTSPAYDILMPIVDLVSDYYHHLFRTPIYLQQFKQHSRGIMDMRLRLYFDQFGQIPVLLPPLHEQQAIVSFYDRAAADTDRVINQTRHQIDVLREYRTRLLADVVTGKLDVREAAATLPAVDPLAAEDDLDESSAAAESEFDNEDESVEAAD